MKKIRKLLLLVLCAAFVAVSALFAVACNDDKADSGDNGGTSGNEQTETTYTVTYALGDHAAAGATAPAAATATEANGYKVTLPAAPKAATGWKFSGWKVGNDVKAAGSEITVSANMTVTAQWVEDVPPAVTYTVTYSLGDHAAANATVPAAATATEANGYKVTLPAAPAAASGWKFNGWKVGSDAELKVAGSEITVSANVTVTAQWAEDLSVGVTFAESWQGTWKSQDNATTLVIGTDTVSLNGTPVRAVTGGEEGAPYAFSVGGKDYTLEVTEPAYSASSLLTLKQGTTSTYLAHSFTSTIETKYVAHWYATNSDVEMEVTASEITYDGTKATFVVDAGYFESIGSGAFVTPVDAHVYLFLVGTELHVLYWTDPYVTVDDTTFSQSASSYVAPEEALGEYQGVTNNKETFSVTHTDKGDVVKYNDTVVVANMTAEFKLNNEDYYFTVKNNILTLFKILEIDPNTDAILKQTSSQFVKKNVTELLVVDQDLLGTSWVCAEADPVTVSAGGKISVNEVVGKIVYKEEHKNNGVTSYSYTVVVGTKVYDVYKENATTLMVEDYDGYSYFYGNGTIDASYNGTYHKNSADTSGSMIEIKDNTFTFDNTVYPLVSKGVGGGYSFTMIDPESGSTVNYTLLLSDEFDGYLLGLSYTQLNAQGENERITIYFLREAASYPPVAIPSEMVGTWSSGSTLVDVYNASIFIGQYKGQVFADKTSSDATSIFVYANGDLYQVLYKNGQLTLRNYGSEDAGIVFATKTEHDTSVKLPDKFKGRWADGNGNDLYVDDAGDLYYNGSQGILEATTSEDVYSVTVDGAAWSMQYRPADGTIYWHYMTSIQQYFTKLEDVHAQVLQWFTNGTLSQTVTEGNSVVVKGLFSGATKGWNGFVVDINANNAWYRLRMDPAAFGLNADKNVNTWDAPDSMFDALEITGTEWSQEDYLALYANGGKAWVVAEATLLGNKLTYVVKTYAETDSKLEHAVTTTTFVLTLTTPATSLNLAYYFDKDGGSVVLSEAYVETVVRHTVEVTCSEGSYKLSPDAWNGNYYEEGTEVTLSVTAPEGKVVDTVTVNDQPVAASAGVYKFTVEEDTTVVVTFKVVEVVEEIFSTDQQGTYKDLAESMYDDVVVVSANKVEMTGSSAGNLTFEGAEITKQDDGSFLLQKDGAKILLTFGDGTVSVADQAGWAFEFTLQKEASGSASGIFSTDQQGTYTDTLGAGYDDTVTVSADKIVTTGSTLGDHTFTDITAKGKGVFEATDGTATYTFTFTDGQVKVDELNWMFGDVMLQK